MTVPESMDRVYLTTLNYIFTIDEVQFLLLISKGDNMIILSNNIWVVLGQILRTELALREGVEFGLSRDWFQILGRKVQ